LILCIKIKLTRKRGHDHVKIKEIIKMSGGDRANIYTHCAACDTALNDKQPIDKNTGKVSDLCGICRKAVRKAGIFHEEDIEDMKTYVWRIKMGSEDFLNLGESYSTHDPDIAYQGADINA
jgi:hypothetical protein